MNDDIRIWEIDNSTKSARPVESTGRAETEHWLEEVLVRNPGMLMPELTLVGRQTPIDGGGTLDLLGVDGDGRLVVFELKRERLTRDAIAQVIDYCSWLESLTEADLAEYVVSHSGANGIEKIDDFESWYGDRQGKQLIALRPTRMALVGLGVPGGEGGRYLSPDVSRVQIGRQNASRQAGRERHRSSRRRFPATPK